MRLTNHPIVHLPTIDPDYGTATFMKVKDSLGNYVPADAVANDSRTIQLGVRFQF